MTIKANRQKLYALLIAAGVAIGSFIASPAFAACVDGSSVCTG